MRLARTEINMAYRYADYERWKDMDFVLGVKIQLSDAHPKYDICDVLQGEYPKNFKFGSWHPHCLCFATPILQSDKDFIAGKQPKPITELPQNFKDWYEFHKDEIQIANEKGKLPYFLRDNKDLLGIDKKDFSDIANKIDFVNKQDNKRLFVSFEPFSPAIINAINKARSVKAKNAIYESILNDKRASIIGESNNAKTTLFTGHKGTNKKTWNATKQIAFDLNKQGISVSFLPELDGKTSADALIKIGKVYRLADFKYIVTNKSNTLSKELEYGFKQANTIVLKLENMDAGQFKETIEYLKRKEIFIGNILIMNKYGKCTELTKRAIDGGKYKKLIKGFL